MRGFGTGLLGGFMALALALAGCKTTDVTSAIIPTKDSSGRANYSLFYDQGDHLQELVEQSSWEKVADLYDNERTWFAEKKNNAKIVTALKSAADELAAMRVPELEAAATEIEGLTIPVPEAGWDEAREKITRASEVVGTIRSTWLLSDQAAYPAALAALAAALDETKSRLQTASADAFVFFDHGQGDFFSAYPIELDKEATLQAAWPRLAGSIGAFPPDRLMALYGRYKDDWPEEVEDGFARALFAALHKKRGNDRTLSAVLGAYREAQQMGLAPMKLEEPRIRFVEVTSQTLLREGQIEFPAAVDVDLPVEFEKASLDRALASASDKGLDYLVVLDVAVARTERKIRSREDVDSEYQSSSRLEPNPARTTAQVALQTAQQQLAEVNMRGATGCIGCGLIPAMLHAALIGAQRDTAQEQVSTSLARLNSTPAMISVPVYSPYSFNRARVEAAKVLSANYYVIDLAKRTYFKSALAVREDRNFTVPYGLKKEDKNRREHLANADSEETVSAFEKEPVAIKLSGILDHYQDQRRKAEQPLDVAALRREMLRDKNAALASYKSNTFDARPLNDPRFDSVVVIYNPQGSLGSGFFVTPDLVLTNFHVVDKASFVEMKLYDGQETFGKVVKTDIRLDLALIRVQTRGKPVRFYDANSIPLGSTVELIGHPKGLNFSITRGVVSAVRKAPSPLAPGGKDILFVQTDAAINRGNSGGPMFLEDRVIGVNTQKLAGGGVEGLGFAIHHSEVRQFVSAGAGS